MVIPTSANERIKPYIVTVLTTIGTAYEKEAPIGSYAAPTFQVEMLPETYNELNWATCHAVIKAVIQNADREQVTEQTNNLAHYVATELQRYVERGIPIGAIRPPWLPPLEISVTTQRDDFSNLTVVWEVGIPTPIGGI